MTSVLRAARSSDRSWMAEWEKRLFGVDAWSLATIDQELSHPDGYYLIAEDAETGEPLGYAGLRAPRISGGQGDIHTVAVSPEARRQGIGRALVRALLDEASSRDIAQVFLEVRADNPGAIALYLEEGFHEITRRPGYYQPDGVDALVMVHERGGGSDDL